MGGVTGRDARGRPLRMSGTLADVEAFHVLQEQLLAATRLASVGTLAAGLAHEINNPLSWMLANLDTAQELLATPAIDPAVARRHAELVGLLGEVLVGAERIAGIVRAMRSLGRPERAGQAQLVDVRGELLDAIKARGIHGEVSVKPLRDAAATQSTRPLADVAQWAHELRNA